MGYFYLFLSRMQLSADRRDGFSAISNIVKDSAFRIGLERSCHENILESDFVPLREGTVLTDLRLLKGM